MTVSRETLEDLTLRYGLPPATATTLQALIDGLDREPDPPTTMRSPEEALEGHVADSLSGLDAPELARAARIADIGSGAGFPGLVLAAALPDTQVDLIEASGRKTEVISRLADAAGLPRARAVHARAEEWAGGEGAEAYEAVTARALAPLAVLAEYAAPLLSAGGALVAWKGARDPGEERAGSTAAERLGLDAAKVLQVRPFKTARARHLHVYLKVRPLPSGFPRRAGMARKRPLA